MNWDAYFKALEAFFNRYYKASNPKESSLVDNSTNLVERTDYDFETVDTNVSAEGYRYSWPLHAEVLRKYSNFFRRALARHSGKVMLKPVDPEIMSFIISWMYDGWNEAATNLFGCVNGLERDFRRNPLPVDTIANTMVLGSYLDMPLLCYEAHWGIMLQLAMLVVEVRDDSYFSHKLYWKQKPFLRAADALEGGGTFLGAELGQMIREFMEGLKGVHNVGEASEVYKRVFLAEDQWILAEELER
ncbi:hypothetical protein F4818DRAFT_453636 [Hypoxylon cercidicola]|nr:hypothetical protein F4818DRAFT_453636 [Hypoxylon cercidicola]